MDLPRTEEERRLSAILNFLEQSQSVAWKTHYGECHVFINNRGNYEINLSRLTPDKRNGEIIVYIINKLGFAEPPICIKVENRKFTHNKEKDPNSIVDIDTLLEIWPQPEDIPSQGSCAEYGLQIAQSREYFRNKTIETIDYVYDVSPQSSLEYCLYATDSNILSGVDAVLFFDALENVKKTAIEYARKHNSPPRKIFQSKEFINLTAKIWANIPDYNNKLRLCRFAEMHIIVTAQIIAAEFSGETRDFEQQCIKEYRKLFANEVITKYPPSDERDKKLLENHGANLNTALFHEIAVVGGHDREVSILSSGKMRKTYRFYGGGIINVGGFGSVLTVYYLTPGTIYLRTAAMKIPAPKLNSNQDQNVGLAYFVFEQYMAERFAKIIEENDHHPGYKHLLKALAIGKNFILLPKITHSSHDKPITLKELYDETDQDAEILKCLGDVALAYDLLSQNNILPVDGKPENILHSDEGAALIDLGSFIDINDPLAQLCQFNKDGMTQEGVGRKTAYGIEGYISDPTHADLELTVKVFKKELPCDLPAKLSLAMMIARLLIKRGFIHKDFINLFSKTDDYCKQKIQAPPLLNKRHSASEIHSLYQLFIKLFHARQHTLSSDPEHISLTEASNKLYELSRKDYFRTQANL